MAMATTSDTVLRPLNGKVAVVSGSSAGIGAAIARELSRRGANVIINYPYQSERENAERLKKSLEGTSKCLAVEADLSTTTGPSDLVAATVAEFGKIDILVNNAGISAACMLQEGDDEAILRTWDQVVNLNGRGTLLLTRAVLKHLSPKDSRIVNISSTTSRNPEPNMSIYAGSKGMIESFTRCWARDLPRQYGCTVNAVAPGPVATESIKLAPPEVMTTIIKTCASTPVAARMAEPAEVAWAVAMLCDPSAGWMNGLYVPVAGGSTLS